MTGRVVIATRPCPQTWVKGYRTHTGARIAAWYWYHVGTYGGGTVTIKRREQPTSTNAVNHGMVEP